MAGPKFFENPQAFRAWLEANAASATEVLVGFYKVGSGRKNMSWSESVDEALCFGWIDGVRKGIDDESYSIRFTPRKRTSIWSAINIAKFHQLQAQGRMTPAGEKAFSHRTDAKSAIYPHEQKTHPELSSEELRAFKRNKAAWSFFESKTPPGYKKLVLHWITRAKRPETRSARFTKLVEACEHGKRLR